MQKKTNVHSKMQVTTNKNKSTKEDKISMLASDNKSKNQCATKDQINMLANDIKLKN